MTLVVCMNVDTVTHPGLFENAECVGIGTVIRALMGSSSHALPERHAIFIYRNNSSPA